MSRQSTSLQTYHRHYTPFRRYPDYEGNAGIYGLVDTRDESLFYVGQAHTDLRQRVGIHFGLRAKKQGEVGSPPRVQERIAEIRGGGYEPRAVRILRCPEWALEAEERRAIGLGQALEGLVNWHVGGKSDSRVWSDVDAYAAFWHDNRGLLPVGEHSVTLIGVRVDSREHVTFIYERGSDIFYNKVPTSYGPKWDSLNHARIRWNVAQALGVDVAGLSLESAIDAAGRDEILNVPVRLRVTDHAVNRAGQAYRRYDMFQRTMEPALFTPGIPQSSSPRA